jgi:hypothetical protein
MKAPKIIWEDCSKTNQFGDVLAQTTNGCVLMRIEKRGKHFIVPDVYYCDTLKEAKKIALERIRQAFEGMEEEK